MGNREQDERDIAEDKTWNDWEYASCDSCEYEYKPCYYKRVQFPRL